MATTLTWQLSALGTKTNTGLAAQILDLKTLLDLYSGTGSFNWMVAGSNTGSSPYYIMLKRKDGSAGRILVVGYSPAPANGNAAIFDQIPLADTMFVAFFPSGNADTASNLSAASGTIAGDDTGAVKAIGPGAASTSYAASVRPFFFDSEEAMYFGFSNPAGSSVFFCGAGYTVIDGADVAYPATVGSGGNLNTFGASSGGGWLDWTANATLSGAAQNGVKTNYGKANNTFVSAWKPSNWNGQTIGSYDLLNDTENASAYFVPTMLMANRTKGGGFPLKLRQIAYGPTCAGPFPQYRTTEGIKAIGITALNAGGVSFPWAVNFKI
jgi:hypothetical protein